MHQLITVMTIILQMVALTYLVNRLKLIALIIEHLFNNVAFPKGINFNHIFVATGEDMTQFYVEPRKQHEEADKFLDKANDT